MNRLYHESRTFKGIPVTICEIFKDPEGEYIIDGKKYGQQWILAKGNDEEIERLVNQTVVESKSYLKSLEMIRIEKYADGALRIIVQE
jgi:hypothetical protein